MYVGIDLGTVWSRAARLDRQGRAALLGDARDAARLATPSLLHVAPEGAYVGQPVEDLLAENPTLKVIRQQDWRNNAGGPWFLDSAGREWHAETCTALLLAKLRRDALVHADDPPTGAVIALPAGCSEAQQQMFCDAAELAGFPACLLVEAPVAAALACPPAHERLGQTNLVYDIGAGFSAAVLHRECDGLAVVSAEHHAELGGWALDRALACEIANQHGLVGPIESFDPADLAALLRVIDRLKWQLAAGRNEAHSGVVLGGRVREIALKHSDFHRAVSIVAERSLDVCERLLARSGLHWPSVDGVLAIGGNCQLPTVIAGLRQRLDSKDAKLQVRQPSAAVALGGAMFAAGRDAPAVLVSQQEPSVSITPAIGFRVHDPKANRAAIDTLIERGAAAPIERSRTFFTGRDDQTRMLFEIVQANDSQTEPRLVGQCEIMLAHAAKNQPVEVTLGYDGTGTIRVVITDSQSGRTVSKSFVDPRQARRRRLAAARELLAMVPLIDS